jgi:hypothetical protein
MTKFLLGKEPPNRKEKLGQVFKIILTGKGESQIYPFGFL